MASDKKGGCILMLEDEELVSTIAGQMLEHLGYEVVIAPEGDQAINLYRERFVAGNPFAAVIMDLTIPNGMGGADAVKEVLKVDPGAKVVVSSGYSLDPVMVEYEKHGFVAAIAKPFSLPELTRVLAEIAV